MSAAGFIEVLLIDDHVLVREGLRELLDREHDVVVVSEAGSVHEAERVEATPDVIVCDLVLPDGRGADVVLRIRERFPEAAVLVLTMVDNPADVRASFDAGARGYLLKEAASTELREAVHGVASGRDYLQPSIGAAMAVGQGPAGKVHSTVSLSARETEVLRLLARGHTNTEVASMLKVSTRTVETHRASLLSKLGVRTRAELVRYAADAGVLDLGP